MKQVVCDNCKKVIDNTCYLSTEWTWMEATSKEIVEFPFTKKAQYDFCFACYELIQGLLSKSIS